MENKILAQKRINDGIVVSIKESNKICITNANRIEEELLQLIKQGENTVLLDFSKIEFIDTAGFQALLSAQIESKLYHVNFSIINANDDVRELFTLVKLDSVFDIRNKPVSDYNKLKKAS
ncbi:MAG: STAS domain-containing protein [Bacteroidetes bacterium]|nr:STAS domain-containing protein [Bacteroidota bacterium]